MTTRTIAPSRQALFARALLDPQRPCPPGVRAWNGSDPGVRFGVHRNNVVSSLLEALADTFPVTRQLVGDAFFDAMARLFVAASPPRSPVLVRYGDGFPAFVADFEPAADVPYLADVARLEVQRVRAFHAADAMALSSDEVARHLADPQALPASRVEFHPSVAVLSSRFAIVSLWAAHQGVGDIAQVDPHRAQCALVLRQRDEVDVIGIAPASAAFFRQWMDGVSFSEACDAAAAFDPRFDLAASLAILIRHGALVAWHSTWSLPR